MIDHIWTSIKRIFKDCKFLINKFFWTHPFMSYELYLLENHPTDRILMQEARLNLMKKDCNSVTIQTALFGEITIERVGMSSEEFFDDFI